MWVHQSNFCLLHCMPLSEAALVASICPDRRHSSPEIPAAVWLQQQKYIACSLGGCKGMIRMPQGLVPGEGHLAVSSHDVMERRDQVLWCGKALIPS